MSTEEWYDDWEDIPCPYCGNPIEIIVPLNDEGVDFESAFLGATPNPFACPHCGKRIRATPHLQWRIKKEVKTNERNKI